MSARLHCFSFFIGAGKAIGVQLAAEAMKLVLQSLQIQVQTRLQSKNRKIIAAGRGLNLAAMRAKESGFVVRDGTGPAGNRNCGIDDFQHEAALRAMRSKQRTKYHTRRSAWNSG